MSQSSSYRAVIIGCGNISNSHSSSYTRHPRTTLVAGMDIIPGNVEKLKERWKVPHGYLDYRKMLAEQKPDIVSICTYMGSHFQMIMDSIEAGVKAIMCEKPFVSSPAELKKVREAVAARGVKIAVGHLRRYGSGHIRAREVFLSGDVGEPLQATSILNGADFVEMGSHWFDLNRYFTGDQKVNWVMAQAEMKDKRQFGHAIEEHGVCVFEYENGVRGLYDSSWTAPGGAWQILTGTRGSIVVNGEEDLVITTSKGSFTECYVEKFPALWHALDYPKPEPWWDYKWDLLFSEFVKWIDGGEEPLVGFSHSALACEMGLAAYLSALHGGKIPLPLHGAWLSPDEFPGEAMQRKSLSRG